MAETHQDNDWLPGVHGFVGYGGGYIPTESGQVWMAGPRAVFHRPQSAWNTSGDFPKLFGANRPTTLWSDRRRQECYEAALIYAATLMGLGAEGRIEETDRLLDQVSKWAPVVGILDELDYRYANQKLPVGRIDNALKHSLRNINPRTSGGQKIPFGNLQRLSFGLDAISVGLIVKDISQGMMARKAAANDLSLLRLDSLWERVQAGANKKGGLDPVLEKAYYSVRTELELSDKFYVNLLYELEDHWYELADIGVGTLVSRAEMAVLKAGYAHTVSTAALNAGNTTMLSTHAIASSTALWGMSLYATYATIKAILEQHEAAQVCLAMATIAALAENGEPLTYGDTYAAQAVMGLGKGYFESLEDVSTGLFPSFQDWLNFRGNPYAELRDQARADELVFEDALVAITNDPRLQIDLGITPWEEPDDTITDPGNGLVTIIHVEDRPQPGGTRTSTTGIQDPEQIPVLWNQAINNGDSSALRNLVFDRFLHFFPGGNVSDYGQVFETKTDIDRFWFFDGVRDHGSDLISVHRVELGEAGICGGHQTTGEWNCGVDLSQWMSSFAKVWSNSGPSLSLGYTSEGWKIFEITYR